MNPFDTDYIPQLVPERSTSKGVRASRKKAMQDGTGWGNGTLPGSKTTGPAPTMMRGGVAVGKSYRLPSQREVLVRKIDGDIVECRYMDDGSQVDFDLEWLGTFGKRA